MLELSTVQQDTAPLALQLRSLSPETIDWWPDETLVLILKLRIEDRAMERYSRLRALWVRVIIRAAFDLASRQENNLAKQKEAESAERWLFGESHLFNSFENVCSMLDVNPERFRTWARNLSWKEVRKMEHMERTSSSVRAIDDDEVYGTFHRAFRR